MKNNMKKPNILTKKEIREKIKLFPGWTYKTNKIVKEFKFADFVESLDFINKLIPYCELIDHHPDVHIFYSKVLFELSRFDVGGKVTDKDFMVAKEIERLYLKES